MSNPKKQKEIQEIFGQFHKDGPNTCINCGGMAYKYFEKQYNGYRGCCPSCDTNWPES